MGFKKFCEDNSCNNNQTQKINEENVSEIYNKFKNKNQDELMGELFKNINKQKAEGTFNYENIQKLTSSLIPYLSEEQVKKMHDILKSIK